MALERRRQAFVIAGTHSGVGKTTVTLTLIRALVRRGLSVQPFKIGPDFIDPAYHSNAAGRESVNLDIWMMGTKHVRETFSRFSRLADVAIVEAMGALFDGENGTARGSAAFVAKLLDIPVILVIDVWGMTRSAIPLLQGFMSFDSDVAFVGFVMNRAGSERHAKMIEDVFPPTLRRLSLGYVLQRPLLAIPERHLGLLTVDENPLSEDARRAAWDEASTNLKLNIFPARPGPIGFPTGKTSSSAQKRIRIAVARDQAFCFYYAENLALLEEAGAELCPFSPVSDVHLPAEIAGIYIGGGYPESFAQNLSRNAQLRAELLNLANVGMPIYAECGGFMYLGRTLAPFNGPPLPMTAIFPIDTSMDATHLAIRYVAVTTLAETLLGPVGTVARGQEFHQSKIVGRSGGRPLYRLKSSTGEEDDEGLVCNTAIGSYVHLHFASNPDIPRNFVKSCVAWSLGAVNG